MEKRFRFSRELYSKEAVMKAAYTFIDEFYLHLDCDEKDFLVEIEPRDAEDVRLDERAFLNEVLIQETRRMVDERTKNLREMMYARAMVSTIIEEQPEEMEEGQTGFQEEEDTLENAEEILVDWFEENEEAEEACERTTEKSTTAE